MDYLWAFSSKQWIICGFIMTQLDLLLVKTLNLLKPYNTRLIKADLKPNLDAFALSDIPIHTSKGTAKLGTWCRGR